MRYRYLMHWYSDREAPLNAGRPLFGLTQAEAVAYAAALWDEECAHLRATGYVIVDTEEGEVVWRQEREQPSSEPHRFSRRPFAVER
jgi:hypothetical protein